MGDTSVKNAIFSILAIIAHANGITATGSKTHARYLFRQCGCNNGTCGGNS
jgi:hypothetical protein